MRNSRPSILRQVLLAYLGFGAVVAAIFPLYADFFVDWKPGMLPWFVVGCFIAGLLIGVANYWVMNLVLVSRLRKISRVASAIAGRDLTQSCALQSHDTLGEIVRSFNDMAATLRDLIGTTSGLSGKVREGSTFILRNSEQIHDRVDGMNARSHAIVASVRELERSIGEIRGRVDDAAREAAEADSTARAGVGLARESIVGIQHIHTRVSSATERVERLAHSSQEVGNIVLVIKEIADQTNLLALNAAIEAARAGEQGRGFAVVADEVRKLAEKTGEATTRIGSVIDMIRQDTGQAIEAIGSSMSEAEQGVALARNAGESLERIIQVVERVAGLVGGISQLAAAQQSAAESVQENVTAIDGMNADILVSCEEGKTLATRFAEDANQLDGAVKSFRL